MHAFVGHRPVFVLFQDSGIIAKPEVELKAIIFSLMGFYGIYP